MALDSQKYFNAARNRKKELSDEFGAVRAGAGKPYGLSDIVESANNFLQFFVSRDSSPEEARIIRANVGFSDSISDSVIPTSTAPNEDARSIEKKKEEERARDALLAELQKQLEEANKRISKMIDECYKMAERCMERMREIKKQIANNNEKIAEYDKKHKNIAEEGRKFERTGSFERGADGKLVNKDAQKALEAYMQRTGEKPEKDSDIYQALLKQMQFEQEEVQRLREKNEELDVEHETLRVQRDEILERAKELTAERNRINNDPSLSPQQKIEQTNELWGRERKNQEVLKRAWEINDNNQIRKEISDTQAQYGGSGASSQSPEQQEDAYDAFDSLADQTKLSKNFNSMTGEVSAPQKPTKDDLKIDPMDKPKFPV